MTSVYDLYQDGRSWLHQLDPRVKLFSILCTSSLLLTSVNIWVMLFTLLILHLLLLGAGIRLATLRSTWGTLWPLMVMVFIFTALLAPSGEAALFRWGFVRCSTDSLARGAALAMRITALAFIILTWLYTTDQSSITRSLVALGLPFRWGLTLSMALRFIPTMAGTFRQVKEAQQARALELDKGGLLYRARAFIPITVAMLISSLRSVEALSCALVTRGFGAPYKRTTWKPLRMRPADWACLAIISALTAAGLAMRFILQVGVHPWRLLG